MNTVGARLVFENARIAVNKAFPDAKAKTGENAADICKLTQSYLRLEREWIAGVTNYEFPVLQNSVNQQQGIVLSTEQRLNQQDSFVISEILIGLAAPSSRADASFLIDTYANPLVYGAAVAAAYNTLYNGSLNITVNNDILVPAWDLVRHYYAPETQATAAWGAASPLDQRRGANDGFYPMEPNVVFIGSKNNVVQIALDAPPAAILANSRIEILLRGVLAQNSTVVS